MSWPFRNHSFPSTARRRSRVLEFERLEDRLLLAGDILITVTVNGYTASMLQDYRQNGTLVSSVPVPPPPSGADQARGLTVDSAGNIDIYNGTFNPYLATYSPATQTWTQQTFAGWSTVGNLDYGAVAAFQNFVFASDMSTGMGGEANGIVRFDITGGPTVRFATGNDFSTVAMGLDGLLYGNAGATVYVYDPITMNLVRSFNWPQPVYDVRGFGVDAQGNIMAAEYAGTVFKIDPTATQILASAAFPAAGSLAETLNNLAVDTDGQVIVGDNFGRYFLTDESLSSISAFTVQIPPQQYPSIVFVSLGHYLFRPTPSFDSLTGATITYGQSPVTLGGHIAAGAHVPSGSVSITLAGVTEAAAIDPLTGRFSAVFDSSHLGVAGSPYTVTYSYPGDNADNPIQDTSQTVTVVQATTSLSALASPAVAFGATATFTGVVSSNSVLPIGQTVAVAVVGAGGTLATGSGTISNTGGFSAAVNTAAIPVGSYTVTYTYAGDANFAASSGGGTLTVTADHTSTTLTSSQGSATSLTPPTLTATVAAVGSSSVTPSGTVTFLDGSTPISFPVPLVNGTATFTALLTGGTHSITSVYHPDSANYLASNSSAFSQVISSVNMGWRDVMRGDFTGSGKMDVIGRTASGQWWVGVSTGTGFINQLWATWYEGAGWQDVLVGDFTGDGKADIAGRTASGDWWVGVSTGSSFVTTQWGNWYPGVTWVDVKVGDFTGTGKASIAGRVKESGQWWVAQSSGSSFSNALWTTWAPTVTWVDVQVGDFTGTGKASIAGRVKESGQWWVAQSNGSLFSNALWTTWAPTVTWVDVQAGDFTGDGKADIAGRVLESGQWWVAQSSGSSFTNSLWTTWAPNVTWVDVKVGDFTGDGKAAIIGRLLESGQWWVGQSSGSSFANSLWGTWAPAVTWVDVQTGDLSGTGSADIFARDAASGAWWTGLSAGTAFSTTLWTIWPA